MPLHIPHTWLPSIACVRCPTSGQCKYFSSSTHRVIIESGVRSSAHDPVPECEARFSPWTLFGSDIIIIDSRIYRYEYVRNKGRYSQWYNTIAIWIYMFTHRDLPWYKSPQESYSNLTANTLLSSAKALFDHCNGT